MRLGSVGTFHLFGTLALIFRHEIQEPTYRILPEELRNGHDELIQRA